VPSRGCYHYDHDEGEDAVCLPRGTVPPGYVLIPRAHLASGISLEDERGKRAHPEFCRKFGIE